MNQHTVSTTAMIDRTHEKEKGDVITPYPNKILNFLSLTSVCLYSFYGYSAYKCYVGGLRRYTSTPWTFHVNFLIYMLNSTVDSVISVQCSIRHISKTAYYPATNLKFLPRTYPHDLAQKIRWNYKRQRASSLSSSFLNLNKYCLT